MIEAADSFVGKVVRAHLLLAQAAIQAERAHEASKAADQARAEELWGAVRERVEAAGQEIDELMGGIAQLHVVFRGEDVGNKAVAAHGTLVDWRTALHDAADNEEFITRQEDIEKCRQDQRAARNELLRAVNRSVRSRRV